MHRGDMRLNKTPAAAHKLLLIPEQTGFAAACVKISTYLRQWGSLAHATDRAGRRSHLMKPCGVEIWPKQLRYRESRASLEVNDDGELVYTKSGLQTEVLKPDQAIKRWPRAERQIKEALGTLD